jgi:all-trans-retinol dehydrogenase (NAD+)
VRGKVVLITGGGRGLGRLAADRFAKLGAKLILWDIDENTLARAKEELSSVTSVQIAKVDVANEAQVTRAAADCGPVDYLINNAGIAWPQKIIDLTGAGVRRLIDTNLISHFTTIRVFLPGMIERKFGHITGIASGAGHVGIQWLSHYCAAKHAVVGVMEAVRQELDSVHSPVTTTVVCPIFIDTPLIENPRPESFGCKVLPAPPVADRIVDATIRGEEVLMIPEWLSWVLPLIRLLPVKLQLKLLGPTPFGILNRLA